MGSNLLTLRQLYAGTEAGVFLVFLFNPLWLVKTRLALQGSVPGGKRYTGFIGSLLSSFIFIYSFSDVLLSFRLAVCCA